MVTPLLPHCDRTFLSRGVTPTSTPNVPGFTPAQLHHTPGGSRPKTCRQKYVLVSCPFHKTSRSVPDPLILRGFRHVRKGPRPDRVRRPWLRTGVGRPFYDEGCRWGSLVSRTGPSGLVTRKSVSLVTVGETPVHGLESTRVSLCPVDPETKEM